jgi:hypothetical protein
MKYIRYTKAHPSPPFAPEISHVQKYYEYNGALGVASAALMIGLFLLSGLWSLGAVFGTGSAFCH